MTARTPITKTYKLFIGGAFPRSESGRVLPVTDLRGRVIAQVAHASRKDLRDAVETARKTQDSWANITAYHRGQILYRLAEMMEGKRDELTEALMTGRRPAVPKHATTPRTPAASSSRPRATLGRAATSRRPEDEVSAAIDRVICFAGWADKFAQVLGNANPVAGPYHCFTIPESCGVVGVVAPDEPGLLGMISLAAPALCAGNTIVSLASDAHPTATLVFAEACAVSDIPPGVVNILTGRRADLIPYLASHRDVDVIHAATDSSEERQAIRAGAAENLKRVTVHAAAATDWFNSRICGAPSWIEPLIEYKTIWHPSAT